MYANPQSILDRVHLFEDHKLIYNLNQMAKVVGINFTKSIDNSDVVLAIYGSNTNQDLVIERYIEMKDDEEVLSTFIKTIKDKNEKIIQGQMDFVPQVNQIININNAEYEVKKVKVILNSVSRVSGTFCGQNVMVELERTF